MNVKYKRGYFDTENDGLLPGHNHSTARVATKFHCANITCVETGERWSFRPGELLQLVDKLEEFDIIIAHNMAYDVPVIQHLLQQSGIYWQPSAKIACSKIISQVINFQRVGAKNSYKHNLKELSIALGGEDDHKAEIDTDWSEFTEEMFEYMEQDVLSGLAVYNALIDDVERHIKHFGTDLVVQGIVAETTVDQIVARQQMRGWQIDPQQLVDLHDNITAVLAAMEDNIKEHTGVSDVDNRLELTKACVALGWEPTLYTKTGQPKLTEGSLEKWDHPVAVDVANINRVKTRLSSVNGFISKMTDDLTLHGATINIGTPTFRQTNRVITNLPGTDKVLGKEIRSLFRARPNYQLVSADASSSQLRILAHYLNDDAFTYDVQYGDIHQRNAEVLGISKSKAKEFIYALLFGSGKAGLQKILDVTSTEINDIVKRFEDSMPTLQQLKIKVQNDYRKQGAVIGLDTRIVFPNKGFAALNSLLQSAESIIMKNIAADIYNESAHLDAHPMMMVHDEIIYEVHHENVEEFAAIMEQQFTESPKKFGVDIMKCSGVSVGNSLADLK